MRLGGQAFNFVAQSGLAASGGVLVNNALDDRFVEHRLSQIKTFDRQLNVTGSYRFKHTFDHCLAAALPVAVVQPVALRCANPSDR